MTRNDLDKLHADTESTVEHTNISIQHTILFLSAWKEKMIQDRDLTPQSYMSNEISRQIKTLQKQLQ